MVFNMSTLNLNELFLKLRLWLKIGLAQEKKGDYDSAKTSYLEAMKLSKNYFHFPEKNSPIDKKQNTPEKLDEATNRSKPTSAGINRGTQDSQHDTELSLSSLKLFYQPYFCLAFLQEKNPAIAHANLKISEDFISQLKELTFESTRIKNFPNLPLFLAECQAKQADLYFYKGLVPPDLGSGMSTPLEFYYIELAENWYWASVMTLAKYYLGVELANNNLQDLLKILFASSDKSMIEGPEKIVMSATAQIFHLLAMNLGKIGNVRLSKISGEKGLIDFNQLKNFFEPKDPFSHDDLFTKPLIQIIACYYYAARLFLRAGMHKECAFEYEKIIRALRYFDFQAANHDVAEIERVCGDLDDKIFQIGKEHYDIAYVHSDRKIPHQKLKNSERVKSAEIESLRLQWLGLLHNFIKTIKDKESKFVHRIQQDLTKQLNQISTDAYFDNIMFRIDCLNYKTIHLAEEFHKEIGFLLNKDENIIQSRAREEFYLKKALKGVKCRSRLLDMASKDEKRCSRLLKMVMDGLFCCINSIEMREIHSNTYWWLHLGRAFLHRFLADWVHRYDWIHRLLPEPEKSIFEDDTRRYLGAKRMKYLDEKLQLQNALENFHQVKQLHTGGKAYKSLLQRMFYLNDDFNDRIYHFYLAQERFEIHRGKVKNNIIEVEELLKRKLWDPGEQDI